MGERKLANPFSQTKLKKKKKTCPYLIEIQTIDLDDVQHDESHVRLISVEVNSTRRRKIKQKRNKWQT